MDAKGIIDTLNKIFEPLCKENNSQFILQKQVDKDVLYKAYKCYKWTVWYINGDYKEDFLIISETGRVVTEKDKEEIITKLERKLLLTIYDYLNKNIIQDMVHKDRCLNLTDKNND